MIRDLDDEGEVKRNRTRVGAFCVALITLNLSPDIIYFLMDQEGFLEQEMSPLLFGQLKTFLISGWIGFAAYGIAKISRKPKQTYYFFQYVLLIFAAYLGDSLGLYDMGGGTESLITTIIIYPTLIWGLTAANVFIIENHRETKLRVQSNPKKPFRSRRIEL